MAKPPVPTAVFVDGSNFYNACVNYPRRGAGVLSAVDYHNLDFASLARRLAGGGREVVGVYHYVGQLEQEGNPAFYASQQRHMKNLRQDGVICRMGRMEKRPLKDRAAEELGRALDAEQIRDGGLDPRLRRELEGLRRQTVARMLGAWLGKLPSRGIRLPDSLHAQLRDIHARWRENVIWQEKAVDVKIAVDMISMAHRGEYEDAYILSADGDYTPVAEEVRALGRKVFAASPRYGAKLRSAVDHFILLDDNFFDGLLRKSQR